MEAVLETCRERVRPVMLTAVTAILGVLPIAFGVNLALLSQEVTIGAPSTQWWIALSSAIVFGLAFSTILTLVLTPAALMVFTRTNESLARGSLWSQMLRRRKVAKEEAAAVPQPANDQPTRPQATLDETVPDELPDDVREFPKAAE